MITDDATKELISRLTLEELVALNPCVLSVARSRTPVKPRQTGSDALAQPSARNARGNYSLPRFRKAQLWQPPASPRLDRYLADAGRKVSLAESRRQELTRCLSEIIDRAAALLQSQQKRLKDVSQRKIARRAGFSWGAWRRLMAGRVDPERWLPRVKEAAGRLAA